MIVKVIIILSIIKFIFAEEVQQTYFPSLSRYLKKKIEDAETFIKNKNWQEVIKIYNELLFYPQTVMIEKDHKFFISLREYIKEQILKLPNEGIEYYKKYIDHKAKRKYELARKIKKEEKYKKILFKFPFTSYEEKIKEELAQIYIDEGSIEEVQSLLKQSRLYQKIKEIIEKSQIYKSTFGPFNYGAIDATYGKTRYFLYSDFSVAPSGYNFWLVAIDTETNKLMWKQSLMKFEYKIGGPSPQVRISVDKLSIYISFPNNVIEKIDAYSGNVIWARVLDADINSKKSIIKLGNVYCLADNILYELDKDTGDTINKYDIGKKGVLIGAKEKYIYIGTKEEILCFDKEKNKIIWEKNFAINEDNVILRRNDILIQNQNGSISIINSENGDVKENIENKQKLINLLNDEDENTNRVIISSLLAFNDDETIALLKKMLKGSSIKICQLIITKLINLKKLQGEEIIYGLRKLLKDINEVNRRIAISGIVNFQGDEVIPLYTELLRSEDAYLRDLIMLHIVKLDTLKVLPILVEIVENNMCNNNLLRMMDITRKLVELNDEQFIEILPKVLKNEDEQHIRRPILNRLDQVKNKNVVPVLKELIKSNYNSDVRSNALKNLIKFEKENAIPLLEEALKDKDAGMRVTGIFQLFIIKGKESIPILQEALKDKDAEVKKTAIYCLAQIEDPRIIPILKEVIKDEDSNIREIMISYLYQFQKEQAVPIFEEMVEKDTDIKVRLQALRALYGAQETKAIPILEKMINDEDPQMQKEAARLLNELKSKKEK